MRPSRCGPRLVLGIETSCDETAVAIVGEDRAVLAHEIRSQIDLHARYGGVVPEIAARAHVDLLDRLIGSALSGAGLGFSDLSGVAATAGPGLIGGLVVGLVSARMIALVHDLPLFAINHLEAHALTARLTDATPFPYLLLLISGGHCQLVEVRGLGLYRRLGTTIDDAVGEAFDKVAKMLGLGYPGGPAIETMARSGDPERFDLPRPLVGRKGCDFSLSGLKTAVRSLILDLGEAAGEPRVMADICASFQAAVCAILVDRTRNALSIMGSPTEGRGRLVLAGGVAANQAVADSFADLCLGRKVDLVIPPPALCTDNAAMVAWTGLEHLLAGVAGSMEAPARARWPLDERAVAALGKGVRGAKA